MTNFFRRLFRPKRDDPPPRDVAALTAPLAAPAAHVVKASSPSRSHFGGTPRLPAGMLWPTRNGKPLGFLARFSLEELHRAQPLDWLPATGALLFFYDLVDHTWGYDPKHRGSAVVLLAPDLDLPLEQPATTVERGASLRHWNVVFRGIQALPSWERQPVADLCLTDLESDLLIDLAESVFQGAPKHQVGGFPAPVQDDAMELECQLVSNGLYCGDSTGYKDPRAAQLRAGASDWRLLFQFDSDDELGIMWGDVGAVYFWIREEAARAGEFATTWLILQCH